MPFVLAALALAWTVMLLFGGLDLDRALMTFFHARDRPDLAEAAAWFTELGGYRVLIPVTAAGALWLAWKRHVRRAVMLLVITLSGRALVELQKIETARERPNLHDHLVEVESLSFPSAHAANSTLVYLSLALLLTTHLRGRQLALWGAVWLSILIGASRVVLGVHWPSDVIAGWAFGLFWALLLLRLSGHDIGNGTRRPLRHSSPSKERNMTDRNDRSTDRAETARLNDDSDLIENMEGAPSHGNRSGHQINTDIGTRDELAQEVGDGSVTRVRDSDKPEQANLPRFNESN